MSISAAQCRAARALLDWTQDQLALNAQVARATVADFERNLRMPIRGNLVALVSTFEAAGVGFIAENGGGAGVRLRKVELEYSKDVRVDSEGATLRVRYRGVRFKVRIPGEVIDDLDQTSYGSPEEYGKAVERHLPIFLRAAEKALADGTENGKDYIILTHDRFDREVFSQY